MKRLPLAALFVFCFAPTCFGGVVFNQPYRSLNPSWTSDLGTETNGFATTGFETWDNFTVNDFGIIDKATWIGFYWDVDQPANNPVTPDTESWTIRLADDNAGVPGVRTYLRTFDVTEVDSNFLGNGTFSRDTVPIYEFSVDLTDQNVFYVPGETGWFSAVSNSDFFDPIFSWARGFGVDNESRQATFGSLNVYEPRLGDRAFSLSATDRTATPAVPEPSTFAIIVVGALIPGLGFRQRHKRRFA